MPLSEYEQRMLQQMEQQLRSDDPKLANTLADRRRPDVRRLSLGVVLVLLGLGGLVGGVAAPQVWLGIAGFLAMLAGVLLAMSGPRTGTATKGGKRPSRPGSTQAGFMQRQEDRWNRRNEERGNR